MGDDNNGECVAHGKNQAFVGLNLQGILDLVGNTAVNGDRLTNHVVSAACRKVDGNCRHILVATNTT